MNTRKAISHGLSPILSFILLLSGLALPRQAQAQTQAQNRVVIINADQPNVWTLEQAHYLLAQMHRRNLDLRAKRLDDLDPNEINGLRFEVLRQLIEFGANFNQADQFTNQLLTRNKTANSERRLALTSRRDKLREESLELTRQISQLQSDKAGATTQEDKDKIDADIAAKTLLRDKVDKEIEFADNELKTLGDISGDLKATEAGATFDANKLPKSVFDKAFEEAAAQQIKDFNKSPQLNATLRLENFLQMQYEIIAKQLTLLRDEVGPGERLLFLELPQTLNVTHHEADKKWAQSWWKIAGYTIRVPSSARAILVPSPTPALADNNPPITAVDDVNSLIRGDDIYVRQAPSPTPVRAASAADAQMQIGYRNEFFNLDISERPRPKNDAPRKAETAEEVAARDRWQNYLATVELNNRIVRTVELIPRQSSLNVNDMKLQTRAGAFNFALSTLFGFGSKLNIQRQREQFSQFVQQELYSSAFGKGSREFGWTFTPMPGTDRLLSGVRTTYAVVVVPEEATSLVLEANGCYFPRSAYQPKDFSDTKTDEWNVAGRTSRNCSGRRIKAFIVPIPSAGMNGSNAFWVRGISYRPVAKDNRIVVQISGDNFSSQIGVLVNGVALSPEIGLAQPFILDDSRSGFLGRKGLEGESVKGTIERVDSKKIVVSFKVDGFEGIPTITLVAPGKSIDLNWLENVDINGVRPATLSENPSQCGTPPVNCVSQAAWMFGKRPSTKGFRIDSLEVFRTQSGNLSALVHGAGFKPQPPSHTLYVNGVSQAFSAVSSELIAVSNIPAPTSDRIQVTLVYGDDTTSSEAVDNPAFMKVKRVSIVSYEAETDKKAGVLVVKLEGMGFPLKLDSYEPKRIKVTVVSQQEAYLSILNPSEAEVVTLIDPITKVEINTVITRKSPPK